MIKQYEAPLCEVEWLEMERSFLTGASTEGYPVNPGNPFRTRSYDPMEDDYDE